MNNYIIGDNSTSGNLAVRWWWYEQIQN